MAALLWVMMTQSGCMDNSDEAVYPDRSLSQQSATFSLAYLAMAGVATNTVIDKGLDNSAIGRQTSLTLPVAAWGLGPIILSGQSAVGIIDFNFPSAIDTTIDMANHGLPGGTASGTLRIHGTASENTNHGGSSGTVRYELNMTLLDPVRLSDPRNDWAAIWPSGAVLPLTMTIDWTRTASDGFDLEATINGSVEDQALSLEREHVQLSGHMVALAHLGKRQLRYRHGVMEQDIYFVRGYRHVRWQSIYGFQHEAIWSSDELYGQYLHLELDERSFGPFSVGQWSDRIDITL